MGQVSFSGEVALAHLVHLFLCVRAQHAAAQDNT